MGVCSVRLSSQETLQYWYRTISVLVLISIQSITVVLNLLMHWLSRSANNIKVYCTLPCCWKDSNSNTISRPTLLVRVRWWHFTTTMNMDMDMEIPTTTFEMKSTSRISNSWLRSTNFWWQTTARTFSERIVGISYSFTVEKDCRCRCRRPRITTRTTTSPR